MMRTPLLHHHHIRDNLTTLVLDRHLQALIPVIRAVLQHHIMETVELSRFRRAHDCVFVKAVSRLVGEHQAGKVAVDRGNVARVVVAEAFHAFQVSEAFEVATLCRLVRDVWAVRAAVLNRIHQARDVAVPGRTCGGEVVPGRIRDVQIRQDAKVAVLGSKRTVRVQQARVGPLVKTFDRFEVTALDDVVHRGYYRYVKMISFFLKK